MLLLQNSAVERISSVFITFSLCKQKFIFVNNSLKSTFININFAQVDHKRKVFYWLRLIHAPVISTRIAKLAPVLTRQNSIRVQGIFFGERRQIILSDPISNICLFDSITNYTEKNGYSGSISRYSTM